MDSYALTNKIMKVDRLAIVKTDNNDGTYRLSIEERGEVELTEPSQVRKFLFSLAEKVSAFLLATPKPSK